MTRYRGVTAVDRPNKNACATINLMHRYLLHNDRLREASDTCLSPGQVGLLAGWGVFSTIRVYDGVLFAWERHWVRMQRDARLLRVPFPAEASRLEQRLLELIEANRAHHATLRVVVVRNGGGMWQGPGIEREFDVIAFTADVSDWGDSVKLGVIPQARHAASMFAGVKVLSWAHNLTFYEEAHQHGFDEVILLNERGEIAECTSANIFTVEGDRVWTPPLSSGCLPGVTRELLLSRIRVPGITVGEKVLFPPDLEKADEVFITSTTRELLPVVFVEGLNVKSAHQIADTLQNAFSDYVEHYIAPRRRVAAPRR